ncbi:MAG: phosphoribosylglycinamide formyltransferase [Flavobacteriia bacterium]|nr:phosphoribosylglycinamide formyltransferase [Flavobacteriia bacterium]
MRRNIVIFASGSGSNAEQIVQYFHSNSSVEVSAFFTNNAKAGVIKRGNRLGIPTVVFHTEAVKNGSVLAALKKISPDLIVLAGYLKLIPSSWVEAFPNKIINIHPALLPKHGGKGMYGMNVHKAVVENGDVESGITIHYVTEAYDEGAPIFQASVPVNSGDTPEDVQKNVQKLEHEHFPRIVEKLLSE